MFLYLYTFSKKKEFLYFSLFLLLLGVNFFLNSTDLYELADHDGFMYSIVYNLINTPLVIAANIFYVLFLKSFYYGITKNKLLFNILRQVKNVLLVALALFFILYFCGVISNLLFNILHLLGIVVGIWLVIIIWRDKLPHKKLMVSAFISNLAGSLVTVCMLLLQNTNSQHILVRDYPYVFIQVGLLFKIFFFNLAIFAKWIGLEKEAAIFEMRSQLAVEKVKSQISKELHDDIGSNLSGIQMYSYMARQEAQKGNSSGIFNALNVIESASGEVVNNLRDIVWAIQPGNDNLQSLSDKISEYALFMTTAKNIRLVSEYNQEKMEGIIHTEWRHQVFMIAKEAINNAVKHSGTSVLYLHTHRKENFFVLEIRDVGSGFMSNDNNPGNGLKNMQKTADEIGATLSMQAKEGKGTCISLQLKIV